MCLDCHTNEEVLKQLNETKREHYPLFNQTSINHLFIAASGYNGLEARKRAIDILKDLLSAKLEEQGPLVEEETLTHLKN